VKTLGVGTMTVQRDLVPNDTKPKDKTKEGEGDSVPNDTASGLSGAEWPPHTVPSRARLHLRSAAFSTR